MFFVSFGGQSARLIGSANQELARSEHPQMVACGATKGRPMMIHRDPASKYHRLLHRSCGLSTYFIPISIYFFVLDLHFYIHLHGISWSHGHDGRFFFSQPMPTRSIPLAQLSGVRSAQLLRCSVGEFLGDEDDSVGPGRAARISG